MFHTRELYFHGSACFLNYLKKLVSHEKEIIQTLIIRVIPYQTDFDTKVLAFSIGVPSINSCIQQCNSLTNLGSFYGIGFACLS